MNTSKLAEKLKARWYLKVAGDTDLITIEPDGEKNWLALGLGPTGYNVVILDDDGALVAYRYTSYGISDSWEIGTPEDVAQFVTEAREERIIEALTDEDVIAWHEGEATPNVETLLSIYGGFQVWGSRDGAEPLHITF